MSAPDASDRRGRADFGLAGAVTCLAGALKADPQEIGGATRPGTALAHDLRHPRGDRIGVDDALDRRLAAACIGASESASGPEACLAQAVAQSAKSAIRGSRAR